MLLLQGVTCGGMLQTQLPQHWQVLLLIASCRPLCSVHACVCTCACMRACKRVRACKHVCSHVHRKHYAHLQPHWSAGHRSRQLRRA